MKLATLRDGTRDGQLIVVDRSLQRWLPATRVAPTMQAALDNWRDTQPALERVSELVNSSQVQAQPLDFERLAAPLPRAYAWLDGSAYLNHMELARKLRNAKMPDGFREFPLMYEGISSLFHSCRDPLTLPDDTLGLDIEGEIGVIVDDVPCGVPAAEANSHIKLITLINDTSLRTIIADRVARGYPPSVHGKPPCSMASVAVTPDELGSSWDGRRLHLPLRCAINGKPLGRPDAGKDMHFDFPALVAHAARYRPLCAGTIVGSGTVSNYDTIVGSACIMERRMVETLQHGGPRTPYLRHGDRFSIDMHGQDGQSVFGSIDQRVSA